jgi:DNA-binding HxlR family transcriptional regulator/putative sterol carrier protein
MFYDQYTLITPKSQGLTFNFKVYTSKLELDGIRDILRGMAGKSYNQYCGLAYALDIVGERWTLLVVRELCAGPRRFTDLLDGLPGISTSLLSDRLRGLEQHGLVRRRVLPPPAGSSVYELTPLGQALEKALIELGQWGSQFVPAAAEDATLLTVGSYALTLKTFFRTEQAQGVDAIYELRIDDEVLQVQINAGQIHIQQGEALKADAVFHTDIATYLGLLQRQIQPDEAIAQGLLRLEGDLGALRRFLDLCALPRSR